MKTYKTNNIKGYGAFANCITRYKHHGFSEKNEVRIVALPTILNQRLVDMAISDGHILKPEKERKFRKQNGKHVPYIELFNSSEIALPIERIIVGPHTDKETRASALRVMLRNSEIEITCSEIPYAG